MTAIKTEKLTKFYGKKRGIENVDLAVNEGEFFGFIGPNGAGKSTTIRNLLGLVSPSGGDAFIFGKSIKAKRQELLADVGYLPSEAMFYHGMKVRDMIKLSADLRQKDCKKAADELCERLQLDTSRKVDELSFGNRKKVSIVCALQHEPRLIVLDEPTSGLDPLMQKEFFDILRERNNSGAAIFMSSHILSEIEHNCTRAAVIRDGHIIACDSVENLSNTGAKRVTIEGGIDAGMLRNAKDIRNDGEKISFLYSGSADGLIGILSSGQVRDFTVTEPDLEEIFMHYYEKDGESNDNN